MQDSYIGSTSASQAEEAGSTPVSCSKKKCHPDGWHFFLEYGPRSELVVRSQAFCRRQTAAMQRITAFGAAKRKCAGTRRQRSCRSTPVRPIYLLIYNVLTTQKEAPSKRMAFLLESGSRSAPCQSRFFDRYSSESVVIYLCCEEGGEIP